MLSFFFKQANTEAGFRDRDRSPEKDKGTQRQTDVCSAEAAAAPPATEIICSLDTFSNLPDDKKKRGKKRLFVKTQTEHEEGWVCFSLVSVDRRVSYRVNNMAVS